MQEVSENIVYTIIERSEDGFWITVEDLPGCYSFGLTISEALENTREAIADHTAGLKETNEIVPPIFERTYEFKLKYDLQTLFNTYPVINKTAFAGYVGINPSLIRQYSKGLAFAGEKQREKIENAIHRIASELLLVQL
jgi:predicted RNase H-like HicB family nuclease